MKAMARPNAQLGVPCRCLVTGLQVNIIPNLLILNSDHFLHYSDFFFPLTQGMLALLYPAMTLNWWTWQK